MFLYCNSDCTLRIPPELFNIILAGLNVVDLCRLFAVNRTIRNYQWILKHSLRKYYSDRKSQLLRVSYQHALPAIVEYAQFLLLCRIRPCPPVYYRISYAVLGATEGVLLLMHYRLRELYGDEPLKLLVYGYVLKRLKRAWEAYRCLGKFTEQFIRIEILGYAQKLMEVSIKRRPTWRNAIECKGVYLIGVKIIWEIANRTLKLIEINEKPKNI